MLAIKAITLAQVLQLKTRAQGLSVILLFFPFFFFFFAFINVGQLFKCLLVPTVQSFYRDL